LNDLDPLPPVAPRWKEPRERYALKAHPDGYVAGVWAGHRFHFTLDLDLAHRWESPGVIEGWLREMPAGHAKRLMDRPLFVVLARVVPERIVASWNLTIPIVEPKAATPG
jgi:hypothetical protein